MGICYYLAHVQSRSYISLGKRLSQPDESAHFEEWSMTIAAFLASHPSGDFVMHNDHCWHPLYGEEDPNGKGLTEPWTEIKRKDLLAPILNKPPPDDQQEKEEPK